MAILGIRPNPSRHHSPYRLLRYSRPNTTFSNINRECKMITRKEYMKDSENLHQEYYLQFATERTKREVLETIGLDNLLASNDKHLNDVKLPFNNMGRRGGWWWDTVTINTSLLKAAGAHNSPSTHTCVGKSVARQLIEDAK